jgi:hypothetical protein
MALTENYSGVVIDQNIVNSSADWISITDGAWRYQEIFLPSDYARGTDSDERVLPSLSGWQLLVGVDNGREQSATLDWRVEYQVFGIGWISISEGTTIGTHVSGNRVWFDIIFDNPLEVTQTISESRLRFGFRGRTVVGGLQNQEASYDGKKVIYDGVATDVTLVPDKPYPVTINGHQGYFLYDTPNKTVTFSEQHGVNRIWYSNPNPLALQGFVKAYAADGTTPIQDGGSDVSICFRILALVADDGTDYLGNPYRSAIFTSSPVNLDAVTGDINSSWMSKPNPSRFAVESLYFDVRPQGSQTYEEDSPGVYVPLAVEIADESVVVDSVVLDPITPGVYFSIYYSSEGGPGTSDFEWENKLWIRVPQTFHAQKRDTYVLPQPIVAKYIKIEFTHLQAKSYTPGDFAKPIAYKKHPKWVLDYFLARLDAQNRLENSTLVSRVAVVYDALDLAYNYYLDDLKQEPEQPTEANDSTIVSNFLQQRTDLSDQVDPIMLEKINLVMAPYTQNPVNFGKNDHILSQYAIAASFDTTYPVEVTPTTVVDRSDVNGLRDQSVIFENDYPVMFFYLTCRHKYREILADFSHDRAYFVGVREVAFLRDNYHTAYDADLYTEPAGDLLNIEVNDFVNTDGTMTVS